MSALSIILIILGAAAYLALAWYIIVSEGGDPGWKAAFLFFIPLVPVVGLVIYVVFGISYRRKKVFEKVHKRSLERFAKDFPEGSPIFSGEVPASVDPAWEPLARLMLGCNRGNLISEGNGIEVITTGERMWEALLADIKGAKDFISIGYFRMDDDESGSQIWEALKEKAREGVTVRYLHEWFGNKTVPRSFYREAEEAGIQICRYTSLRQGLTQFMMRLDSRNHRKITVIDGRIGYVGGMNLNDNYRFRWRDTHIRFEGPAAHAMQASFLDTWLSSGGSIEGSLQQCFRELPPAKGPAMQIISDEPDFPQSSALMAIEWALANARDYVYLQTPYFFPPDGLLDALKAAALRGVDVRIMLPLKVDTFSVRPGNCAHYVPCLEAGVKLYEWDGGIFIHAKTLVADDYLSMNGATNLDFRSFFINHELNALVYDRDTALRFKEIFMEDLKECTQLSLEGFLKGRSALDRFESGLARLVRTKY